MRVDRGSARFESPPPRRTPPSRLWNSTKSIIFDVHRPCRAPNPFESIRTFPSHQHLCTLEHSLIHMFICHVLSLPFVSSLRDLVEWIPQWRGSWRDEDVKKPEASCSKSTEPFERFDAKTFLWGITTPIIYSPQALWLICGTSSATRLRFIHRFLITINAPLGPLLDDT